MMIAEKGYGDEDFNPRYDCNNDHRDYGQSISGWDKLKRDNKYIIENNTDLSKFIIEIDEEYKKLNLKHSTDIRIINNDYRNISRKIYDEIYKTMNLP